MRSSLFALFAYCALFALGIGGLAQAPITHDFTTNLGIIYTQGASAPLTADAYIPSGTGAHPAILFIHGGGWVNGNRNQMVKLIVELADQGYVGFTIEYDVDPVHYPASFNESLAALTYMREHAQELHLDPGRIAVVGSSAGGELAALVALSPMTRPTTGIPVKQVAPVQAAVILNGVLDLTALGDQSKMVTDYLGGPCTSLAVLCADATPTTHAHTNAPPFYVGHGTADQIVPFSQAEAFVAALRRSKVEVRFYVAKDGAHTYWNNSSFYAENLANIEDFLAVALHNKKK